MKRGEKIVSLFNRKLFLDFSGYENGGSFRYTFIRKESKTRKQAKGEGPKYEDDL